MIRWPHVIASRWLCALLLAGGAAAAEPARLNCGVASILAYVTAIEHRLEPDDVQWLTDSYPDPEVSLGDLIDMAARLELDLVGYQASLDELRAAGRIGIAHLREPEHFVAFLGADEEYVQIADGPTLAIEAWPVDDFTARFTGHCVLPDDAFTARSGITLEQRHVELGDATAGSVLEHSFAVRNLGAAEATIRVRNTSCTCTAAQREALPVAPGETADVAMTMRIITIGRQLEYARLVTGDPAQPLLFLTLSATGLQGIHAAPRTILLRVLRGESDTATVRISTPVGVSVTGASCEPDLCEVTPRGTVAEEQRWLRSLELRLRDDLPAGEHTARLIINTNEPDGAPLSLPVRVTVVPVLQAFPARLADFHVGTDGALFTLRLTARDGRAFAIETCEVAGDGFALLDVTPRPEGGYLIRLRGRPERGAWIRGTLAVETDLSGETLAVPLLVEGAP